MDGSDGLIDDIRIGVLKELPCDVVPERLEGLWESRGNGEKKAHLSIRIRYRQVRTGNARCLTESICMSRYKSSLMNRGMEMISTIRAATV